MTSQNWFTFEDESADNTEGRNWRFLVNWISVLTLTPFPVLTNILLTLAISFGFTNVLGGLGGVGGEERGGRNNPRLLFF